MLKPKAVIGRVQSLDTIRLWQRFATSSTIVTLFHLTGQVVAVFLVMRVAQSALLSGRRATTNCNNVIAIGHKPVAFFVRNRIIDNRLTLQNQSRRNYRLVEIIVPRMYGVLWVHNNFIQVSHLRRDSIYSFLLSTVFNLRDASLCYSKFRD